MFGCASSAAIVGRARRVHVVEQKAHAHSALGRLPQRFEEQVAHLVPMPDVVLHIERLFRGGGDTARAAKASWGAGRGCIRSCPDSRLRPPPRPGQPRPRRVGDSRGLGPAFQRGQARAAHGQCCELYNNERQDALHLNLPSSATSMDSSDR